MQVNILASGFVAILVIFVFPADLSGGKYLKGWFQRCGKIGKWNQIPEHQTPHFLDMEYGSRTRICGDKCREKYYGVARCDYEKYHYSILQVRITCAHMGAGETCDLETAKFACKKGSDDALCDPTVLVAPYAWADENEGKLANGKAHEWKMGKAKSICKREGARFEKSYVKGKSKGYYELRKVENDNPVADMCGTLVISFKDERLRTADGKLKKFLLDLDLSPFPMCMEMREQESPPADTLRVRDYCFPVNDLPENANTAICVKVLYTLPEWGLWPVEGQDKTRFCPYNSKMFTYTNNTGSVVWYVCHYQEKNIVETAAAEELAKVVTAQNIPALPFKINENDKDSGPTSVDDTKNYLNYRCSTANYLYSVVSAVFVCPKGLRCREPGKATPSMSGTLCPPLVHPNLCGSLCRFNQPKRQEGQNL